ncbi:sensor histidine kinase [Intrasporangium calvum]|uniref:Oxygen sensor histidine kinase NreB n=1 Tax=Intrasporangium calvum TaxID=53358 RepID=A0ABT5GDM6_9MICO|nr:sensor histidine kinase [Intrasporangium calvum]MDC5696000.1 sensor histidine kinase [Intrasporangium calvum]
MSSSAPAQPRPLVVLTRALLLGQHALFAILLLVAWARAAGETPWFELVAAGLGLGYAALAVVEHRTAEAGEPSQPLALVLLLLLLGAWFASVSLTPDFAWLAFPLFFAVLRLLPSGWALPLIVLMVLAVVWSHARLSGWADVGLATVVGPTVGALVSVGMAHAYRMLLRDNAIRQDLVDQLAAAKADLEATHESLAESRRQAGVLEERARLSRDIHDTLAQGFSSILLVGRAASQPGSGPIRLHQALEEIERQAASSLAEARAVIADLTPQTLSGGDLPAALERLVTSVSELSGIRATFELDGEPRPLPRTHEVALLRLAQGALANVTAHAAASRVVVSLSVDDGGARLDVVDDGVGFEPGLTGPREDGTGYGLRSMRERMTALGGQLTIESAPGSGTAVAAHLPAASA